MEVIAQIKAFLNKSNLACDEEAEYLQLENALFYAEKAVIKLRTLVEESYIQAHTLSTKKCPTTKYSGRIEVNEFGWLHITLNSLLPHCKYKTPEYLIDTLSKLLEGYRENGGSLPYFEKAALIIDEHCDIKNRQIYDSDNKGWKAIPNVLKGIVVADDDQFSLEMSLLATQDSDISCHIYVMKCEDVSDYFSLRNDPYNHYF